MKKVDFQVAHRPTIKPGLDTGPGLTEQSHKKECDMNYIIRKFQATGLITHAKTHEGKYDDIDSTDFREAMEIVTNANAMFADLPSNIRKRFGNDPTEFMDFVHNPANQDEMMTLGIIEGNDGRDASGQFTGAPVAPEPPVEPAPTPPAEPAPT